MYPVYRCMDSFPHQRNQMPYTQHYYPSFEGRPVPPQIKVDPSGSPVTYETWPYGGSYGHSIPGGCHGFCSHNYFPGYSGFRPPHPHFPPPLPFQCHGGYPFFPETYPVHYVHSPHYSMEQPNVTGDHHCCGCPNHSCNRKEDRRVKIEEQEPDVENKSNNSPVPVELKNYPYPFVLIPPGYMNREKSDPTEPELKQRDKYPRDVRAHENLKPLEQEPNVRSGWFPFDINNIGSDVKKTQDQPNEDMSRFPFPIFWMPYKSEEDDSRGRKEANAGQESAEKLSSNSKTTLSQFPGSDDRMNQPSASKEKFSSEVGLKTMEKNNANQETISVKKQEEQQEKGKARVIAVKEIEPSGEKKPSQDGPKRQSSSPPKMSKLPPVCLRVDPLPKRKQSNGNSRSPSPGHREKAQEVFGAGSKSTSPVKESTEVEPNIKVVKVVDGIAKQGSSEDCKAQTRAPLLVFTDSGEGVSANQNTGKAGRDDDVKNVKEDKEARNIEGKKSGEAIESQDARVECHSGDGELQTQEDGGASKAEKENPKEEDKAKRKHLSEAEAAVIIQSAYRGFEVRKGEPLKKLKQIAEVRDRVAELRSRINSLESSSDICSDERERLVIGENIMSLLLKLDTIQGLHPTVRNFRKSVAKELVSLQEKLDSLTTKKPEVSTAELVGDLSMNTRGDASFEELKEEEVGHGNSFVESINMSDSVEPCYGQVSNITESTSGSQVVEISEMKLVEKEACEQSLESSGDLGNTEAEPVGNLKDDLNNEVFDDGQMMMLKAQTDGSEIKLPVEPLLSVAEENVDAVVASASPGVFNQEFVIEDSRRNEQIEAGNCEVLQGEVESHSAIDITTQDGEVAETNQVQQLLDALKEEPVIADLEHETGRERGFECHEDAIVEQEGLLVEAQVKEVGHIDEFEEIPKAEDGSTLMNESLQDVRLEIEEFTEQKQGGEESNINDLLDTSGPQPQLSLAENEIHGGEACNPEEPHPELSLAEDETHGGEASKLELPQPELSPLENKILGRKASKPEKTRLDFSSQDEICSVQRKEICSEITYDEDNSSGQEKQVPVEETKDCIVESKIIIEEDQEMVEGKHESEELELVVGNNEVALGGAERPPTSSKVSLGSDEKLLEENKMLREMMEKLIEAGKEQLTAISNLSGKVKDLEKKLARKKKSRTRRFRAGSSCDKPANDSLKGTAHGITV